MRDSASLASAFARQQLPAGLMQRLEMMQQLALQVQADGQPGGAAAARRQRPRRAHIVVLAWFSLGVMTSCAAGVGAHLGLRALDARGAPATWASVREMLGAGLASAWAKMPAVTFKAAPVSAWDRVEVKIDRSRSDAPLGLSVTGGDGQPVFFVLEGLPVGVRPSHGAAVGPATWVISSDDIGDLRLSLDAAAPSDFDLKIALLTPGGVARSGSLVQVRVVDGKTPVSVASSSGPADGKSGKSASQASAGVGP